jgi:TPR repeat protein
MASSATAVSQFACVASENEFQLHLPFGPDAVVQPYVEDRETQWPLTQADMKLFEAEAKASNAHAQNNLGELALIWTRGWMWCVRMWCGCFVAVVHLFGWCSQRKDEAKAYALMAQAAAAGSACAAMNLLVLQHQGLGCRPRPLRARAALAELKEPRSMCQVWFPVLLFVYLGS